MTNQFATNRRADFEIENVSMRGEHWNIERMESARALEFVKEFQELLNQPTLTGKESRPENLHDFLPVVHPRPCASVREYERKENPKASLPMAHRVFEGLEMKAIYTKYVAGSQPIPASGTYRSGKD